MPAKFVNLLMMLLVAFWATGLARSAHEWAAHGGPAHGGATHGLGSHATHAAAHEVSHDEPAAAVHGAHAAGDGHAHPAGRGECVTCQSLAVMVAATIVATVLVLLGRVAVAVERPAARVAPRRIAFLPALPSCGPPTLA